VVFLAIRQIAVEWAAGRSAADQGTAGLTEGRSGSAGRRVETSFAIQPLFGPNESRLEPSALDGTASLPNDEGLTAEIEAAARRLEGEGEARGEGMVPIEPALEQEMLSRAQRLLLSGDIAGARLIFEDLARRGSALGAFALAQSYDPGFLSKLFIPGLEPDPAKAEEWYRKAIEFGSHVPGR
jgi:TPR repeat protein